MPDDWRSLEFFLPADMSRPDAATELRHRVLLMAADSGEFVRNIRITDRRRHCDDWTRWTACYLPGPPRIGRPQREMSLRRVSHP